MNCQLLIYKTLYDDMGLFTLSSIFGVSS